MADSPTIDEYLAAVQATLDRVTVGELADAIASGAILVDIRPVTQRDRDGAMPGALVIDRNVLEWRLAPSSSARSVELEPGQQVIVVCNEGYQSSLAAAELRRVGVDGATDLVGGYQAFKDAKDP
jgi:rhodanese-related sulfurtransferase